MPPEALYDAIMGRLGDIDKTEFKTASTPQRGGYAYDKKKEEYTPSVNELSDGSVIIDFKKIKPSEAKTGYKIKDAINSNGDKVEVSSNDKITLGRVRFKPQTKTVTKTNEFGLEESFEEPLLGADGRPVTKAVVDFSITRGSGEEKEELNLEAPLDGEIRNVVRDGDKNVWNAAINAGREIGAVNITSVVSDADVKNANDADYGAVRRVPKTDTDIDYGKEAKGVLSKGDGKTQGNVKKAELD
jgi:hypothetical protein